MRALEAKRGAAQDAEATPATEAEDATMQQAAKAPAAQPSPEPARTPVTQPTPAPAPPQPSPSPTAASSPPTSEPPAKPAAPPTSLAAEQPSKPPTEQPTQLAAAQPLKEEKVKEPPVTEKKETPVEVKKEPPVEVKKESPVEVKKEPPVEVKKETPVEVKKEAPVEAKKAAAGATSGAEAVTTVEDAAGLLRRLFPSKFNYRTRAAGGVASDVSVDYEPISFDGCRLSWRDSNDTLSVSLSDLDAGAVTVARRVRPSTTFSVEVWDVTIATEGGRGAISEAKGDGSGTVNAYNGLDLQYDSRQKADALAKALRQAIKLCTGTM